MGRLRISAVLCLVVAGLLAMPAHAITWLGGAGDDNWSSGGNWTGGSPPGPGQTAEFDDTAAVAAAGTVTNIVDADIAIGSLAYKQFVQNAKYHTTQINGSTTLKATDALEVNNDLTIPPSTYDTTVNTTITGAGTLEVGNTGESTAHVLVGYNSAGGDIDTGILNMAGLASFAAHLDEMTVGTGGGPAVGTVTLAAANTINANTMTIGEDMGTGTLDLSAGATLNAYVNTLAVGILSPAANSTTDAIGTVRLPTTTMIEADAIYVGYTESAYTASSASIGTGTLSLSPGDTLTIGNAGQTAAQRADLRVGFKHTQTATGANGTLDLTGGTFNAWLGELVVGYNDSGNTVLNTQGTAILGASNTLIADTVRIGDTKATGTVTITAGGTLTLGSAAERADLFVGYNEKQSGWNSTGTLDLSNGTLNAWLDELAIGRSPFASGGHPTGTVTLGTANSVDVNTLAIGVRATDTGTLTIGGGTVTVNGDVLGGAGTSTLNLDGGTMTVNGGLTVDNLLIGKNAKTGSVVAKGAVNIGGSGALDIGIRDIGGTGTTSGTLDLTQATSVNIHVDTITLGDIPGGGSTASTTGTIHLGSSTSIQADTFYVGRKKGTGIVDIVSGGTLTLGTVADPANLHIGYNDENTSMDPAESHFDMTGGKLVARLDDLIIGYKGPGAADGRGIGRLTLGTNSGNDVNVNNVTLGDYQATSSNFAQGIIRMSGGTFDVAGSLLRGSAAGTGESKSIVEVRGGTMTVGGDVAIDQLTVGDQATGTFRVTGATATIEIGTAANPTDLAIGRKTASIGASGTVDLSAAASLTAWLGHLAIGQQDGGTSTGGGTTGLLKLAASNTIAATTITVGEILGGSTSGATGTLRLGTANTLACDTLKVGSDKSTGTMNFLAGGSLALGTDADRPDVLIGAVEGNTSLTANGHIDLGGGSCVAYIDEMVVGRYVGGDPKIGTGSGLGTLSISSDPLNDIHVNSVVLGDYQSAATHYSGTLKTARGTINFAGGTFSAGSIMQGQSGGGTSIAEFNWTGGTLHADTFGFDLLNTGTGTLAPGASIGTTDILGAYTQGQDATLEIEIDGADFDFVHVTQAATLDGMLDVLFITPPPVGSTLDVLVADGGITDLGMDLSYPGSVYMYYSIESLGGSVEAVRLHYTPEPATMALLGLPLALFARRRERKNR